jgi:hypothetical protein
MALLCQRRGRPGEGKDCQSCIRLQRLRFCSKWSNALRLLDARLEGTADERWVRRVNLSIMYQVLQIEPMAYLVKFFDPT